LITPLISLAVSAGWLSGCSTRASVTPPAAIAPVDPEHVYALLINGGGRREVNYQSHRIHLDSLLALLDQMHVPPSHISIFSGDGEDPAADLATRELSSDPDLWLLPSGGLVRWLRPEIVYVNSAIAGFTLQPAKKATLQAWFADTATRLRPSDILLLYVTDHGEKNPKAVSNNTITLWGEDLSVSELRELLAELDPGVRVVMVMSQCFSGAFANTIYPLATEDDLPGGNVCGYFAVTGDRPAYGCYPENRGKDGIGHSHHLFEALAVLGTLPESNRRVQVTDRTPDVPHSTATFYLEALLRAAAARALQDPVAYTDALLTQAWQNRARWEPDIRLLDRIGLTFGSFSPRSLAELNEQSAALPEFSTQLRTYGQRWSEALEALRVENFERFLEKHPAWRTRLGSPANAPPDAAARQALATELLRDLVAFTHADRELDQRLRSMKQKSDDALAAGYRTEVRVGAVLRMNAILSAIAGQVYLEQHASEAERTAYARLVACEALPLGPPPQVASAAALDMPAPFPTLVHEREIVDAVMPAWMGINYRPVPESQRKKNGLAKGAATVMMVFADSAAAAAGLQAGDIILGPPEKPFNEPHALREWTMRSEIDAPAPLRVWREGKAIDVTLRPQPFPLKMPELPGPPKVGNAAPALKVDTFRGEQVVQGKPRLLFFWATWCLPCKAAVPEILAFARARGIEVVAITDETPEVLTEFFKESTAPFPARVAMDPLRLTFQRYGVSGTPTFVLVDEHDVVRHYHTGYDPRVGLTIEGWKWDAAPNKRAAAQR
jgi:thiol-disulfide isomerase/thioredoxin